MIFCVGCGVIRVFRIVEALEILEDEVTAVAAAFDDTEVIRHWNTITPKALNGPSLNWS